MKFFRKKEQDFVERRRSVSSLIKPWFRNHERCNSSESLSIDAANDKGQTMLHVAATDGSSSMVQQLLQEGANVNSEISGDVTNAGYTPLHCAAREGNEEIVKLLLSSNARVDSATDCGLTALHVAAERGNVPIAEALLNHGASIDSECTSRQSDCRTPLHFALRDRHLGMVKLLLASKTSRAKSESLNKCSETTFRLAWSSQDCTIMAYVFMCHVGFDVKDSLEAVKRSEIEYTNIAQHISKWISNVFARIDSALLRSALLHSAVEMGYLKIVKDFLKRGVYVRTLQHPLHVQASGGTYGFTLLHTAAKHWQLDIAKLLINHRADVNAKDNNQRTPIFFAIEKLDVKMTKLLLDNGATVDTGK